MKLLTSLFVLVFLTVCSFAQPKKSFAFKRSVKAAFDSCEEVSYLIDDLPKPKEPGRLVIPINNKKPTVFISEEEMEEYTYLGNIKHTSFALVRLLGPNTETYYLINQLTGHTDTLIALPVFARDLSRFVCINNPGVDESYMLQMGTIKNGVLTKSRPVNINGHMLLSIRFSNKNRLIAKDYESRYWEISFSAPAN